MPFICGQSGEVTVGVTTINVTGWSATSTQTEIDTTNTASGGYTTQIYCQKSASGTFTAGWDTAAIPTAAAPGLVEGAAIDLHLYITSAGDFFDCPIANVQSIEVGSEVDGQITYTVSWKNNGPFAWPV